MDAELARKADLIFEIITQLPVFGGMTCDDIVRVAVVSMVHEMSEGRSDIYQQASGLADQVMPVDMQLFGELYKQLWEEVVNRHYHPARDSRPIQDSLVAKSSPSGSPNMAIQGEQSNTP